MATEGYEGKEESVVDQNTNKVATARKSQCDHRHKSNTYIDSTKSGTYALVNDITHFLNMRLRLNND